jgi:hypothetical protein
MTEVLIVGIFVEFSVIHLEDRNLNKFAYGTKIYVFDR